MKNLSFIYERDLIKDKAICNAIGVMVFIILTTIGAYVRIPLGFTPVPITLQTFFALLAGAILGKRLGAFSQLGYLIFGAIGVPVFSGAGSGLAHMAGPTGGYLIGFIVCAFLVGRIIELGGAIWWKAAAFALGLTSIYFCGVLWLSFILNISVYKGILLGVVPFLPGAAVKLALAVSIYLKFGPRIRRIFLI